MKRRRDAVSRERDCKCERQRENKRVRLDASKFMYSRNHARRKHLLFGLKAGEKLIYIYIYPEHAVEYSLSRAACKERERHVNTDDLNSCINGAVKTRSSISSLMNVAFFHQMGCARFRKCGSDLSIARAQMASNKIKMIYYDRFACARLSKQTSVLDN